MTNSHNFSRRGVLKGGLAGILATGVAPLMFTRGAYAQEFCNAPSGDSVTLGFNMPLTGAYADEGADQQRAYELAVEHLNGGGDGGLIPTFSSKTLKGSGILGKKVAFVTGDDQTKADAGRDSARRMIERDGAVMITGGSSSAVAIAEQGLCQEMGVIYMAGLTHSNDTTGKDKKKYGFRHFFNAYQSGIALGPVLGEAYGKDRVAYHLTADYTWGWTQEESMIKATEALGWKTMPPVRTPVGAGDFSQYITPFLNSGADVLVLNHYGFDGVNSITQAVQFGLRDRQANGKNVEIVLPLVSDLMAKGAGEAIKGVYGTANWDWQLTDEASKAFTKSFGAKYGQPPSQIAQTSYVQVLLYADAVERAGTFYPPEVIKALEGYEFDGLGNGPTLYRAADHQCFKDVYVVKGKDAPSNPYDLLEVVGTASRDSVTYDPAIFGGELGPDTPAKC
ncbi:MULTISPECIES: substrate-binding protein [unclassified Devosia]|uniref:substrate-binding protein n=1 Tax=unclassified Devosia TaxID=196773 RepID=UPI00086B3720|nr:MULTISPECIES: substrate-binding protein [unclassified Devosia]MBN9363158.1 substrate-binding protein [Devosia sp.]ODS86590.1 MAG: branched-chain amino acid ABC transporter substrate-binding protein [Devosia sp. SCN 66-27]OJX23347.1 MAG: branched-chain amino acid ABC transporter substrate-binding protein [Devosia sp. 66-14]